MRFSGEPSATFDRVRFGGLFPSALNNGGVLFLKPLYKSRALWSRPSDPPVEEPDSESAQVFTDTYTFSSTL